MNQKTKIILSWIILAVIVFEVTMIIQFLKE